MRAKGLPKGTVRRELTAERELIPHVFEALCKACGLYLRASREATGLTRSDWARQAGVSDSDMAGVERGSNFPVQDSQIDTLLRRLNVRGARREFFGPLLPALQRVRKHVKSFKERTVSG